MWKNLENFSKSKQILVSESEVWTCNLMITCLVSYLLDHRGKLEIMFVLLSKSVKVNFWQTKCTNFKHILALLTYDLKSPDFEQEALKKWKMEPGHPV